MACDMVCGWEGPALTHPVHSLSSRSPPHRTQYRVHCGQSTGQGQLAQPGVCGVSSLRQNAGGVKVSALPRTSLNPGAQVTWKPQPAAP